MSTNREKAMTEDEEYALYLPKLRAVTQRPPAQTSTPSAEDQEFERFYRPALPHPERTQGEEVMSGAAGIYNLVPTVSEIPDQTQFNEPNPNVPWRPYLNELLALAQTLTDAGYPTGGTIAKADAIWTAVTNQMGQGQGISRHLTADLIDLPPETVAARVREAALDLIAGNEIRRVSEDFETALARSVAATLRQDSDKIVKQMRTPFNQALRKIHEAADAGLRPDTKPEELLATGTEDAIAAYRGLETVVATLDHLASLRTQMATIANIGPHARPVASLLAEVNEMHNLEGAENTWRGVIEPVQYNAPFGGSTIVRSRRHRVGGSWLALVASGYSLRINTAEEADAILRGSAVR